MTESSLEARLAAVEARVAELEALEAIRDLISRYGPAADACDASAIAALWTSDGAYAFDDTVLTGEQLAGLVELDTHRELVDAGCAHVLTAPRIDLDGDRAVAVCHSIVFKRSDDAWLPARVSANRWELVHTRSGWLVERRVNRLLNGAEAARALLASSVR
ncbi:nuclear transport factor 2 family protein [Agromyces sp. NPDC058484]|uniref:nuclear transport factor 2 family protein n=1 Tax=Agromyces sp. NPDC058484 TaxID=3346524 RepID=UPI0036633FDA